MSRKKVSGKCHVCGTNTRLTFEHVPPRKAFNDRPIVYQKLEELIKGEDEDDPRKGRTQQRGFGGNTLCSKCNNNTGSWYGGAFVEWAYQGLNLIEKSKGESSLYLNFYIFPLRVIKQIVCMFCSANGNWWADAELRRFLLNKNCRYLPGDWRLYVYFNISNYMRQTGITAKIMPRGITCFSEISFPPFGYVLSKEKAPPDKRHQEITFFGNYAYNEWKPIWLKLPLLPVSTWIPGDYRTKDQVKRDIAENKKMEYEQRLSALQDI